MTRSRDPIGDRPAPEDPPGARVPVPTPRLELTDAELLAAFAATVARYLDDPEVAVAWGPPAGWRPIDLVVDLDAPFAALVAAAGVALDALPGPGSSALPTFGVAPRGLPEGPGPALLALDAHGATEVAAGAYADAEVSRFVGHLTTLATAGATSDVAVGRLPLTSASERDLLAPSKIAPPAELTLVDLVRARVEADPGACAVVAAGRSLTFAELWQQSADVASRLPAGRLVGVWGERGVDLVVGLLGVLRAGSAYVALDPGYPIARLRDIAELADLGQVVAGDLGRSAEQTLAVLGLPVVRVGERLADAAPSDPAPGDLAYVMFTSGSTGVPKGVMVEHRGVVNTLLHMADDPGLAPGESMLGVTTPAFDLSVPDLFLPLVTGATLVLAAADDSRDPAALARLIDEFRPRLMQATPSTWRLLLGHDWEGAPWLRAVCGGEAYDAELLRALSARVAGVWNFYGPTEATVWSVCARLTGVEADPLPLGAPMRGVACYVLDGRRQPAPPGVRGELAIAGAGLARGYLDRPDLTAAVFVPCPFPGAPSERMYLTGDLARVCADGTVRFAGRRDDQVKLNGFRVELGEVEAAVSGPGVDQAVAVVRTDDGRRRIVCYVTGEPDADLDPDRLRSRSAAVLAPQSVPAVVVVLDRFPMTPNGKIDRSALPAPANRSAVPLDGELEVLVATAYGDLLGVPVDHADDNLLALGADSLVVSRVAVRLGGELGIDVAPGLVFRNPVVGDLARVLLGLLVGSVEELDGLAGLAVADAREAIR